MVQAVIFDFDGTLVDFVGADVSCLEAVHAACGVGCSPGDFVDAAVEEIMRFHVLVDDGMADPLEMHRFRLENTLHRYGIPWDQKYLGVYRKRLIEQASPFAGVEELLKAIKKRGVKLGLVTNAYDGDEQRARIESSGLGPYFDGIVISGEVGYAKPSPEIFRLILERFGVPAGQAVHVGDLEKYDIRGANAAGMQSILLCPDRAYRSALASHTCHGIDELHEHLDRLLMQNAAL